jgi:hypothetical protein
MVSIARRGTEPPTRSAAGDPAAELVLTSDQQAFLRAHGYGPGAPPLDFQDAAVRTHFVAMLRECGALPPAAVPKLTARPSRSRRHFRRAG